MRKHPRTSAEIGDHNIAAAAHPQRPGVGMRGLEVESLRLHQAREVRLPEPVDADWVGWRRPEPWEEAVITAGRQRERRLELALLAGTVHP
jgi:hypothetical protein